MPLVRTDRASNTQGNAAAGTDLVTPSFTPSNNSLLVVVHCAQKGGGGGAGVDPISVMTITDTAGLTWTIRRSLGSTTAYGPGVKIMTAPVITGVSMTVTVEHIIGDTDSQYVSVVDYTGYDATTPIGAGTAEAFGVQDGAASITLDATPASTSEILGCRGSALVATGTMSATNGAGYTEIHDLSQDGLGCLQTVARDPGSTSTTFAWTDIQSGAGGNLLAPLGLAIEIRADVSGAVRRRTGVMVIS